MRTGLYFCCVLFLVILFADSVRAGEEELYIEYDPYLDYEVLESPENMKWILEQNKRTIDELQSDPRYKEYYEYILNELNSKDRLIVPTFFRDTDTILNFWRDARHPQGIVRESTIDKFFAQKPDWRTVIDFDALSAEEGKTLVYGGATRLFGNFRHGVISLSDGGKDAVEYREFDYIDKKFVEDGFNLPESKSGVSWVDKDTLLVASSFDEDDRTESGYPRKIKVWRRGVPFSEAETIFSCGKEDLGVSSRVYSGGQGTPMIVVVRQVDFFNDVSYFYRAGKLSQILLPTDSTIFGFYQDQALVWLKSDWQVDGKTYAEDSIVNIPVDQLTQEHKDIGVLYKPAPHRAFQDLDITDGYVYLSYLDNVKVRVEQYRLENGLWLSRQIPMNDMDTVAIVIAPRTRGFVIYAQSGFTRPSTLYLLQEKTFVKRKIQALPQRFDPEKYTVRQEFATSLDGTRIPYFMVYRKGLVLNGDNPVLQYGYGGFLSSLLPGYSPIREHCWMCDGGIYVEANIRGGSEYGPAWHKQALKGNRPRAFEDFIAVSEDMIKKKYTNASRLGIEGGSNGGLLTASVMVMRPDLYNAVIIEVPLLDMLRYHKLPPGASWIGEYGNPDDPDEREDLLAYSPYQNLKKDAPYPQPLLLTSTKDDRVHPAHARKFAKRLEEFGRDFLYYEEVDGGHGGNANAKLAAKREAMKWVYMDHRIRDAKWLRTGRK